MARAQYEINRDWIQEKIRSPRWIYLGVALLTLFIAFLSAARIGADNSPPGCEPASWNPSQMCNPPFSRVTSAKWECRPLTYVVSNRELDQSRLDVAKTAAQRVEEGLTGQVRMQDGRPLPPPPSGMWASPIYWSDFQIIGEHFDPLLPGQERQFKMRMVFAGTTDFTPENPDPNHDFTVGWGTAGANAWGFAHSEDNRIVRGQVGLTNEDVGVAMHEFGHALGLGHVRSPSEIMGAAGGGAEVHIQGSNGEDLGRGMSIPYWGPGDREGLSQTCA